METDQERIEDLERKVASLVESFDQINSARPVEPMAETPAAAAPAADDRGGRWWQKALGMAEPLSLAGLFIFFLWKTWLRWPEPLIDFSRYLYIPWRMSQGALLYRDLVCYFGPLPLLVQAEAFRLFGPGVDVIIWLNIAVTAAVLALLRGIFQTIGNRFSGWLCGVVFVVVFAMPLLGDNVRSLFNFIAPYACQTTWGFGGVLLTVYALLRHAAHVRRRWLFVAGIGLGIAYLDKSEVLLAAAGVLGVYLGVALLQTWRQGRAEGAVKPGLRKFAHWLGWVLAGFLAAYLPVFFFFVSEGGWVYGFHAVNWTLQVFLNPDYTRVTTSYWQDINLGFDHPWANLLNHLHWGLGLGAFCAVAGWAGWGWQKAQQAGRGGQEFVGLIMAMSFLVIFFMNWLAIGLAFLAPTALAMLVTVGWCLCRTWQGHAVTERMLGLAVVATAAMLMLARMLLNVRIFGYGFFLGVLATLLVVHLLVYELPLRFGREAKLNGLLQATLALLVLAGTAQLGRLSLANYAHRIFPVGWGRDRFYSYTPDIDADGIFLNSVVDIVNAHFSWVNTVVAFPESQGVNYYLRKINSVANMQFAPDDLEMAGIDNIVAKLTANPPEAVVITARRMPEYGVDYFGENDISGKAILDWVKQNYAPAYIFGKTSLSATGYEIDIYIRRDLVAKAKGAPARSDNAVTPSLKH